MLNDAARNIETVEQPPVGIALPTEAPRFRVFNEQHLDRIPQLRRLSADHRFQMQVVASVLVKRNGQYVRAFVPIRMVCTWSNSGRSSGRRYSAR